MEIDIGQALSFLVLSNGFLCAALPTFEIEEIVSAIDSELRSGGSAITGTSWPLMAWSACGAALLLIVPIVLPSHWLVVMGASVLFVLCVAVLDRTGMVKPGPAVSEVTHRRIEAYYRIGQEIYRMLANDGIIAPEDVRPFVADIWVNPTTQYLKGTMGDEKAEYFLSISGDEPEAEAVVHMGYERALARKRIVIRLDRLRKISGEV